MNHAVDYLLADRYVVLNTDTNISVERVMHIVNGEMVTPLVLSERFWTTYYIKVFRRPTTDPCGIAASSATTANPCAKVSNSSVGAPFTEIDASVYERYC